MCRDDCCPMFACDSEAAKGLCTFHVSIRQNNTVRVHGTIILIQATNHRVLQIGHDRCSATKVGCSTKDQQRVFHSCLCICKLTLCLTKLIQPTAIAPPRTSPHVQGCRMHHGMMILVTKKFSSTLFIVQDVIVLVAPNRVYLTHKCRRHRHRHHTLSLVQ